MPKRILTTRCQKDEPIDVDDVFIDPPKNFDFDFRHGQAFFPPPPKEQMRPRVHRSKGSNKCQRQCTTPRFQSPIHDEAVAAVDKRLQLTKVEDSWIGVALGSPTHPPPGWREESVPDSIGFPSCTAGQSPQRTPSSRWKKIGGIFRAKSPAQTQPLQNSTNNGNDFGSEQYKLGVPVHRVAWRNPHPPPDFPMVERTSMDIISQIESEVIDIPNEVQTNVLSISQELPQLDVEIPSTEMERYSIMFRGVNGMTSSALSARQSKLAASTRTVQVGGKHDLPQLPVSVPRKLTTPTPATKPYSLFPSPPKTKVFDYLPNARATEALLHVRSASAPATLSPCRDNEKAGRPHKAKARLMQNTSQKRLRRASITEGEILQPRTYDARTPGRVAARPSLTVQAEKAKLPEMIEIRKNSQQIAITKHQAKIEVKQDLDIDEPEVVKPSPLRPRRGPSSDPPTSPDDNVIVSDEYNPWGSKESLKSLASSHTSIEDEIFFDIKSFRGSNDQSVPQFEILRPDSTAVQLARSMSRKAKTKEPEQVSVCVESGIQPVSFCMPPDLQAAEYYCKSSKPEATEQMVRLSMFDETIAEVQKFVSMSEAIPPLEQEHGTANTISEQRPAKPTIHVPTRRQGYPIAVPSPVPERSEECTPISALGKGSVHRLRHIVSQASHSSSDSPQNSTSSIWDEPPPVPEKDIKYLPISKYSVCRKTTKPIDNNDSYALTKSGWEHPIHVKQYSSIPTSGRSASFSVRTAARQDNRKLPVRKHSDQTSITVTVQPPGECSVARTVSLRRKSSHQILVSRSSSRRDDHPRNGGNEERLHWSMEKPAMSPVIVLEVPHGHKPGASVDLVVESI